MKLFSLQPVFSIVFLLLIGVMISAPNTVSAINCPPGGTGIWKGTSCSTVPQDCKAYPVKPCNFCDGLVVTKNILDYMMQLVVPLALAMIIYGAIRMMIAAGSEQQFGSGKKIITSAVVGVIIAFSGWIIVNTVIHIIANPNAFPVPWSRISC